MDSDDIQLRFRANGDVGCIGCRHGDGGIVFSAIPLKPNAYERLVPLLVLFPN